MNEVSSSAEADSSSSAAELAIGASTSKGIGTP